MDDLRPAGSLHLLELMQVERADLLHLLGGLDSAQWAAPTECPAWSVKGIVLHLLGDDLSIVSRQRDDEPSGTGVEPGASFAELFVALDGFNERWVTAASHLSVPAVLELLRLAGHWVHAWYATVEPDHPGEAIPWISSGPAPYWLIAAREYLERWIHHHQILRAVGRRGVDDMRYVEPAIAAAARGFPLGFSAMPGAVGTTITLSLEGGPSWTVRKDDDRWSLLDGAPSEPTVTLPLDAAAAVAVFSRALTRSDLEARLLPEGDADLGGLLVAGLAAFFGRDD